MTDIIELVEPFGKYQKLLLALIGGISSLVAMNFYCTIFMTSEPILECKSTKNITDEILQGTCDIWSNTNKSNTSYKCSFDKTYYGTTIITDWNLICDRHYLASLTQTFFMVGTISGMVGGVVSDTYGRKISSTVFICLMSASLVISQLLLLNVFGLSVMAQYIIFSINQFFCGILVNCLYCTAYVLLLELTTDDYHTVVSNVNLYFYVIGELIVLVAYYVTRNWYALYWIISIYSVIFVLLTIFILPESPRWLLTQKRYDESLIILTTIGKVNGKNQKNYDFNEIIKSINKKEEKVKDIDMTTYKIFKHIFCFKESVKKIYLLIYIWIAISLLYYGVSMGITALDFIDPYLIYLISSIAEIIGLSLCYLNDRIGRKKALFCYLIIASITCSIVALIPQDPGAKFELTNKIIIKMALALVGKCMVSAAFNTCYMFTAELYMTSVRNTIIQFLTCIGGVGSLISPQINLLRTIFWEPLPYIIYSASSFLACFCLLFLPETHHNNV